MEKYNQLLYVSALVAGFAGAWGIVHFGHKYGLMDKPNTRSSHTSITPKGGGIGILAAFLFTSIFLSLPKTLWIPATILSLFSLWGDKFDISPLIRLCFQFAASLLVLAGIYLGHQTPLIGYWLIIPFSIFIVGTANCYNFMDGINGIAGITGAVGFGFLSLFAFFSGIAPSLITLSICISFSCLGFLPLNMPRAKVFMGDVGSILLGFLFAALVVSFSHSLSDFICLVSFLFTFYADELTTMVVRIKDGENLTRPHRRHLYQLLCNELKIQHWKITVSYGLLQLLVGTSILQIRHLGVGPMFFLMAFYFTGFAGVSFFIRRKVDSLGTYPINQTKRTPLDT